MARHNDEEEPSEYRRSRMEEYSDVENFQWLSINKNGIHNPVRAMWFAVLGQAINDLLLKKHAEPASNWINDNRMYAGSFRFVCDILDLNYEWVRQKIHSKFRTVWKRYNKPKNHQLKKLELNKGSKRM